MLSRLETMVLMGIDLPLPAIQRQIASGIDILIHLGRLRDKSRKVLKIMEVLGYEQERIVLQPIFTFEETGDEDGRIKGKWLCHNELFHKEKLLAAGNFTKREGNRTDEEHSFAECNRDTILC